MSNRYWVGGAGNWSSTTKWSTSSGGASGASVPTSVDDAIFDANSGGKFTATVDTAQQVNSLTITPSSGAGLLTISLTAALTTGNLTTTGTAGNNRIFFTSTTYGIAINFIVNGTVSISDCDFRGLYVTGTAAPISGTRIGNRGECRGITFSTPKTVYWNLVAGGNWSDDAWALSSGGAVSTDNFPLPQDTATFVNTGLTTTGSVSSNTAIGYFSTIDMSARTTAMSINMSNPAICYGNWINGSGSSVVSSSTITFSGGGTQTITSAGKAFAQPIAVDTYGGTVQLADALSCGNIFITNGTFNTQGYNLTCGTFSSNNSNVRTISFGASTITPTTGGSTWTIAATNLTFNAGTSTISSPTGASVIFAGGGLTYYNVNLYFGITVTGANTFNNLTLALGNSLPSFIAVAQFSANQTINGTLTCASASAVRRIFLQSNTIGTQRTLTVNSISADDCDFRDINLSGTASGASPTRAGDCGGNAGITFPSSKTVYWNLAGAQSWSATGWATSSGGLPAVNNFPLAQDTAVFDNTGSVTGTITIDQAWNIGTFDASARTSAMTFSASTSIPFVYGDWKFGTGITVSNTAGSISFSKNGTQTITSNGVQFGCNVAINRSLAYVQLADALSVASTRILILTAGTFDAVTYNVTTGLFQNGAANNIVKMGSGTWTLSGTGTVWNLTSVPTISVGTSTVILSDTSAAARSVFVGGQGHYFNKLTIGGSTGSSALTLTGTLAFGELASTKTVAHTITFPSGGTITIGKWSVTGTAGNVVTLAPSTAATTYTLFIAGPANSGIDYLSISYCAVSTTSPGEFYVGANSTNTAGNTGAIIFTATPAPRTLYWVGGAGNWSSTTKWSISSGGGSGAAIPTSLDAVVFDSLSNATAYTATIDAGVTLARCASFTMAGPASGNVTFAGTVAIAFHGNVSFAATGITRTYTGAMNWAGNSSYTFTTNGLTLASDCTVIGIGSTWTLGSALNIGTSNLTITYGTFSTSASNYSITGGTFNSSNSNIRSISFNASSVTFSTGGLSFSTSTNLSFSSGTSTFTTSHTAPTFAGGSLTFYNVSFTSAAATSVTITGANTFNTLSFAGRTTVGITPVTFSANQTITTLTLNAGTTAAYRTFLASDTIGTQRTLSVGTLTAGAADYDFRDIAITGAAAPLTGTRFGDCKGNSGITFPAAKTVYYRQGTGSNWGDTGSGSWSATSGGALDATAFPLAQDTALFPYPLSTGTVVLNASYNIGTIDMSARTSNTMTLDNGTQIPTVYGNWINGTGTTLGGTGRITFAGRGSQTITSAGKTWTQSVTVNTPSGSVTLQDAFTTSINNVLAVQLVSGTFDASTYNVTLSAAGSAVNISGALVRTLAIGSGTWTIAGSGTVWNASTSTNLTITGTGTISLTSASAKAFAGGGASYSGITLNQGGAGALTISGNNTFKDITNTYSATGAANITIGNTTQTVTQFTGTGAAAKLLTIQGTSAASPGTLILTSGTVSTPDYLSISNVRAYSLSSTWYAGANSTNLGSLGWIFAASGGVTYNVTITETGTGTDAVSTRVVFNSATSETATGSDTFRAGILYLSSLSETATATQTNVGYIRFPTSVLESASATETVSARATFRSTATDTATGTDAVNAPGSTYNPSIAETGTASDLFSAINGFFVYIAETATGSDTTQGNLVFSSAVTDSATGLDSITARATFRGQISDSASSADLVFGRLGAVGSISETATGSDAISAKHGVSATVLDLATASDAASARAAFRANLAETATGTDVVTAPGSTYNPTIIEAATGTAVDVGYAGFRGAVSETATGSDAFSANAAFGSTVLNTASITDSASARAAFGARLAETATATDLVLVAPSTFNAPVVELATVTDALTAPGSIYNPSLVETITISDFIIGGYLWNLIDDSQTPDWGIISDAQAVTWTPVDDSQSPAWQNISSTQTGSWTVIDDDQDPEWAPIPTIN